METKPLQFSCPHCGQPVDVLPHAGKELVTCPAEGCGKPFEVRVPQAEPAPQLTLTTAIPDAAPSAPAPLAESIDREEEIRTVKLSMFRRFPFRCLGYGALILGGVSCFIMAALNDYIWFGLAFLAVALVALFRLVRWWLRVRHTTFTLTNKRCVLATGVFSQQTAEVPLSEVNDVQIGQSMFTRWLNVGDLVISTKNRETTNLVIMAVPDPAAVADLIRGGPTPLTGSNHTGVVGVAK